MTYRPEAFLHQQRALRVLFQPGAVTQLREEVDRLDLTRVVLITSGRHLSRLQTMLGDRIAAVVDRPMMHVPVEQVDDVVGRACAVAADGAVAVGGGSAIGLAKALALRSRIPIVAVPTTFSGSEMTRVWGITANGIKTTGRDDSVAPRTVIYDPDLLATFPVGIAVPSAFNAIAHAVEALYAPDRTPITGLLAAEGIRAITAAIPHLIERHHDAPGGILYGAWLSGLCLDSTTMALHHKLCHVLGGTLGLLHAETHTAVLPHALAFNGPAAPDVMQSLRATLGAADPANFLFGLAENAGATMALSNLGMTPEQIGPVADLVLAAPYANPRTVTKQDLEALLHRALVGAPAASDPASPFKADASTTSEAPHLAD